jgi:hypothetical protein
MAELSSREITQRKIADALDYLGDNYNIVDKAVREGKATNMDIARGFTGDVKSDKLSENIGLLDFTPAGTYFAFEEGEKAIMKAEPDAFKRNMALLSALRKPLQTAIDRPDIGMPAIDMMAGVVEAVPFLAVATKPVKNFLASLKAKATEPLNDVGMNIQKTSLPISGEANTTTNLAENQEFDPSRRKFFGDVGKIGSATLVGGALAGLPVDRIVKKIAPKVVKTVSDVKPKANIFTFSGKGFEDTLAEIAMNANFKPIGSDKFRVNEMNDIKLRLDDGDYAPNELGALKFKYKRLMKDELLEKDMADFLTVAESDFASNVNDSIGDLVNATDDFQMRDFTKTGGYDELEKSLTGRAYMKANDLDAIDSIDDVVDFVKDLDIEDSPYFKKP